MRIIHFFLPHFFWMQRDYYLILPYQRIYFSLTESQLALLSGFKCATYLSKIQVNKSNISLKQSLFFLLFQPVDLGEYTIAFFYKF